MSFQPTSLRLGVPLALLMLFLVPGTLSPAAARPSHRTPAAGAVARTAGSLTGALPTARGGTPLVQPTEMSYVVQAHADDESAAWSWIENRPLTYTVFVLMTQGEQTEFCMSAEEVPPDRQKGDPGDGNEAIKEGFTWHNLNNAGPWGYQGPDSPVGELDKGERDPLGDPWRGKGTKACKNARVASWHWFLDAMATHDPTIASMGVVEDPYEAATYRGRFCGHGDLGCARVWATGAGARVVFDAGDGQLSVEKVIRGVNLVRDQRARWGLPADLPEAGVLAAVAGRCDDHVDHSAVQDAVYTHDFDAGPQLGAACDENDPRFQENPAPPRAVDPADLLRMNMIDPLTEDRQGAYNVNYGWLMDTYAFTMSSTYAWQRFG